MLEPCVFFVSSTAETKYTLWLDLSISTTTEEATFRILIEKSIQVEKLFCSVFFQKFWQIWRLTSPNLRFLQPTVTKI